MKNDKISVIIPVYNSERFLKSSIESVLNQSYENFEIIAVDDGSTDNSAEILRQYDSKIEVISQENQGLFMALNNAIKKMTGNWFKWLSPDDVLNGNCLEILVNEAKKLPENSIVYSNWDIIDENGKTLRNFFESDYNNLENFEFNIRLLDDQHINVNTSIIPPSLFKRGCIFQNLADPVVVDYDFFLRAGILFGTHFHLVPKSLLKYRIHTSQLSHKDISKTLSSREEVRNKILSELSDTKKDQYLTALKEYKKKKPFQKKTMDIGLKIATNTLPSWLTNKMLVFYLNNLRRGR